MTIRVTTTHDNDEKINWIKRNKLKLIARVRICGHILRKRACPSTTWYVSCVQCNYCATDHWRVWERPDGSRFALAHVYVSQEDAEENSKSFAALHGLTVISDPADGWYGYGTIPLRYEVI